MKNLLLPVICICLLASCSKKQNQSTYITFSFNGQAYTFDKLTSCQQFSATGGGQPLTILRASSKSLQNYILVEVGNMTNDIKLLLDDQWFYSHIKDSTGNYLPESASFYSWNQGRLLIGSFTAFLYPVQQATPGGVIIGSGTATLLNADKYNLKLVE